MNPRPWTRPLVAAGVGLALAAGTARGASHREAPLMTLDPAADITDVHVFVSYDQANLIGNPPTAKVTMIMNVVPGQEPSSGPNYYAFDDNVLYQINIDNDRDGDASDTSSTRSASRPRSRSPDQFLATLGGGPLPPISAIDGPGSEGLSRVQRYTVTELRDCKEKREGAEVRVQSTVLFGGMLQPTVPSNIGPRTMPDYDTPAAAGHPDRRRDRHPRLRRPERRDLRHRPRRRLRHREPARRERDAHPDVPPAAARADRGRGRERLRQPVRHQRLQRLQRQLDRHRGADQRASPRTGNPPAPRTARSASTPARRARCSPCAPATRVRCRRASRC